MLHNSKNMTNQLAGYLRSYCHWWLYVPRTILLCGFAHFIKSQVQIWRS